MELGVMVDIGEDTDIAAAFRQAREAGFARGQVNLLTHGITPDEVRDVAVAAQTAGFHVDAVGCPINPLRPDDAGLSGVDATDWRTVAANMGMMNGVERLVCWSGTRGKTLDAPNLLNAEDDTLRTLFTSLSALLEGARGLGVQMILRPHTAHALCDAVSCVRMARRFAGGDVRIAVDGPGVLNVREYEGRDAHAQAFAREVAAVAGMVILRDTLPPEDGQRRFAAPGQGTLAFGPYLEELFRRVPEVPMVVDGAHTVGEMWKAREFVLSVVREYGLDAGRA